MGYACVTLEQTAKSSESQEHSVEVYVDTAVIQLLWSTVG